jgi:hypothetical protein
VLWIYFALPVLPLKGSAGDARTVLFTGVRLFFKAEARTVDDVPNGEIADLDAACGFLLAAL